MLGLQELRDFLFKKENDPVISQQLLEHLRNYMWLGGMPAVLDAWITHRDPQICQKIQDEIIESYQIDFHKRANLYYWHREAKSSNAEVDFVVVKKGEIIPVEVKSAHKGRMKSLHLFLESHANTKFGLKISSAPFAEHDRLIEIPLYALESWFKS